MTNNLNQYSKKEVNAAGLVIREANDVSEEELDRAIDIVSDWRASHAIPLQVMYDELTSRAKRIDPSSLTAFRHKRLASIITKLSRFRDMKLTTMQDIGGCRAVMNDMKQVQELAKLYGDPVRDYLRHPKEDGYRSLHFVKQFDPPPPRHQWLKGRRIEIQIRSRLQHAWASAVESVDSLFGENLKLGGGTNNWKAFFRLAGDAIAAREGCHVQYSLQDVRTELREMTAKLRIFDVLGGVTVSVAAMNLGLRKTGEKPSFFGEKDKPSVYVLRLDLREQPPVVYIQGYEEGQLEAAKTDYAEAEKQAAETPDQVQVVLVSVKKLDDLKQAYPSYWLDSQAFLNALKDAVK